jgi:hypothetical protein
MGSEEIARNTLGSCSQLGADDKGQVLRRIFGRGFLSGYALAFWQPSLTCSLDNPLEFLFEGWIVGNS